MNIGFSAATYMQLASMEVSHAAPSAPNPTDNTYKNPEHAAEIMRSIHQQLQQSQRGK